MSVVMDASSPAEPDAVPRVRDMARAAVVRMAFSAAVSVGIALMLLALAYGTGR